MQNYGIIILSENVFIDQIQIKHEIGTGKKVTQNIGVCF